MQNTRIQAIHQAITSPHGSQLLALAREQLQLARELPPEPAPGVLESGRYPHADARQIILAQIEHLRQEQAAIINQFEGGVQYGR
ncbi:hypothetical protein D3C76_307140 [compost metagenome]